MRQVRNEINKRKVVLSSGKVLKKLESAKATVSAELCALYDLNYIDSPSALNERCLRVALVQEFGQEFFRLFSNLNGEVDLSMDKVKYALRLTVNEDFRKVLRHLSKLYTAQDTVDKLSSLCSITQLTKKPTVEITPSLAVSLRGVSTRSKLPLEGRVLMDCFNIDDSKKIVYCGFRKIVYVQLCKELGIPDWLRDNYIKDNKALFLKGATHKDELEFLHLILTGSVCVDGDYSELFINRYTDYYESSFNDDSQKYDPVEFDDKIYSDCFDERNKLVDRARKSLNSDGNVGEAIYMTRDYVAFVTHSDSDISSSKTSFINRELIIGSYVVDWVDADILSKLNCLHGISGEYIAESDCKARGYITEGLPTMVYLPQRANSKLKLDKVPCYNISQVHDGDGNPLSPLMGKKFVLEISSWDRVYSIVGSKDLYNTFMSRVTTGFEYSNECTSSQYVQLVADLTCALVSAECGEYFYTMVTEDLSFVTEELFNKACYDAEVLFDKYNF